MFCRPHRDVSGWWRQRFLLLNGILIIIHVQKAHGHGKFVWFLKLEVKRMTIPLCPESVQSFWRDFVLASAVKQTDISFTASAHTMPITMAKLLLWPASVLRWCLQVVPMRLCTGFNRPTSVSQLSRTPCQLPWPSYCCGQPPFSDDVCR